MAKISEQSIEKIRNAADIYEIVSNYVDLKKRGRNYFGLCPVHNEKTPSFSVNPDRQIYKCFGCGIGGSSIDFIMEVEKLDFVEAIRYLAEQYSIELEISGQRSSGKDIRTELYEMNAHTQNLYKKNLYRDENQVHLEYFLNRGIDKELIEKFGLGLSFNKWNIVWESFQGKKLQTKSMLECGLFTDTKKGYIDRFRNRIMFTIHDSTGKPIAFAGRAIDKNDNAKYINSPETLIYNKSKTLYGLHQTKNEISSEDFAIVVEGYFDFLQIYKSGIKNVVAVSGTSFTDGHANILKRLTKNVKIAYDGDSAGISAAIRAGFVLLKNGLRPSIIEIPPEKDPDDWIFESGNQPFLKSVEKSTPLIEFSYKQFKKRENGDIASFINEINMELSAISDSVIIEINLNELARLTGISVDSIQQNFESLRNKKVKRKTKIINEINKSKSNSKTIDSDLLMLCFSKDRNIRELIYKNLNLDWISNESTKRIYNEIYIHLNSEFEPQSTIILDRLEKKQDHIKLTDILFEIDKITPTIDMAISTMKRLEYNYLIKNIETLREKLKTSEEQLSDTTSIINDIVILQNKINSIRSKNI